MPGSLPEDNRQICLVNKVSKSGKLVKLTFHSLCSLFSSLFSLITLRSHLVVYILSINCIFCTISTSTSHKNMHVWVNCGLGRLNSCFYFLRTAVKHILFLFKFIPYRLITHVTVNIRLCFLFSATQRPSDL